MCNLTNNTYFLRNATPKCCGAFMMSVSKAKGADEYRIS
jgi:hypothetical protein